MKRLSIFFTIFIAIISSYSIVTSAVSTTYRINVNINPGAINTSVTPPKQDFRFGVTVTPQPPQGTKAILEAALVGRDNYTDRGTVPFVLPGQISLSNRETFNCGLNAKVRIKLDIPGMEPEYSADFPFTTQTCSGGSGQQLGANQKLIPVSTGGDYLVTLNLSPSNTGSTTILISGNVANRTDPQKPITRVGLEIKEQSTTTYTDRGNIDNQSQGTGVTFSKSFDRLKANTMYDVRVWVTSGSDKKYTEPFSFQTKKSDGTGGQTSDLVLLTLRLSGNASEENTTVLFTAQIPGSFALYRGDDINFGVETESEGTWETVHTEASTVQGGPDIIRDKQLSSRDEDGWGFTCGNTYKIRGFLLLRENERDPRATRFVSPEVTISTRDCDSAVTGGTENEPPEPGDNTYTFLTPLPFGEGLESQDSVVIGAVGEGGILGILQRIFTIMLITAVVLAVVFIIIGGTRYATGDTLGGKMGGRQIITNAVTGLLFALLAWLLLNIVNPDLLRFTLSIPKIGMKLTPGSGNGGTGGDTITGEGCGPDVSNEECFDLITADEARVRKIFTDAGFTFNADPCVSPDPDVSGCTNVGKLSPTTINALLTVKRECNCAIMITGGTEYWLHAGGGNHKAFTAVDLRIGQAPFDNFVKSKTKVGNPFDLCTETYSHASLRFCNESGGAPHWHVDTVKSSSGNTGSGNTGNPKPGQLFTFPRINIQGYVVSGTGSVYTEAQLTAKVNAQAMKALRPQITAAASSVGIDSKLFYALVAQESAGNPQAGSGAGACGVAQLLPDTARPLDPSLAGLSDSAVCTTLKNNVDLSLRVGAKYLKEGFQRGGGEDKNALAYYNGGPAAVANSNDCPGRKAYECPWDAPGYYDRTKPSGPPLKSLEKQGDINTGFSETRFYVINILKMKAIPN